MSYDICLSLSDLTSLCITDSRFLHLTTAASVFTELLLYAHVWAGLVAGDTWCTGHTLYLYGVVWSGAGMVSLDTADSWGQVPLGSEDVLCI